jgi:PKHD-type hydroxylase
MDFGDHIDNAIRTHARSGQHLRTDISVTVFLADVDEYEGGELVIEDSFGVQTVKLAAGSAILYPASSLHRVNSVTRGARLASFFWVESRVRDAQRRRLLYEIDSAIASIRQANGESLEAIRLTGCYHNLLRMWDGT